MGDCSSDEDEIKFAQDQNEYNIASRNISTPKSTKATTPKVFKSAFHYSFEKGTKGKLTTKHNNPRLAFYKDKSKDEIASVHFKAFAKAIGGSDLAIRKINSFKSMNEVSPEMADGLMYDIITSYGTLTQRAVVSLFGIGSGRYTRCKRQQEKKKRGGCNGLEASC